MSFRKRNVGLAGSSPGSSLHDRPANTSIKHAPGPSTSISGVRPSPLDGRLTTSTGTQTLDDLLAGYAGLALGSSLLIEENGTTDFAGALLRYYAAEGLVQEHRVHAVGVGEQWGRELPGLVGIDGPGREGKGAVGEKERMKIAWRYERLGEFGVGTAGPRGGIAPIHSASVDVHKRNGFVEPNHLSASPCRYLPLTDIARPTPNRNPATPGQGQSGSTVPAAFCHSFDLTKRLSPPSPDAITFIPVSTASENPFPPILQSITTAITDSPPTTIHRIIIPGILSPALFPPSASDPLNLLPFLHSLRRLLRQHSTRLTAMVTLPLSLYPRSTGLVRWIEHLCDGVLELAPFPHSIDIEPPLTTGSGKGAAEEKPQGMLKIHKLPVFTERGGGAGAGDDLAFSLSRKRFVIKPFCLPPVEGDREAQNGEGEGGKATKGDVEF